MNIKYLFRTALCALIAITSACSNDDLVEGQTDSKQITMTATDFQYADGSRTSIEVTPDGGRFTWAENDTVGIFPNEGAQAYFPMTNGAGTKTAKFNGGGWALKPSSTYAAYYPFIKSMQFDKTSVPISYENQVQTGNGSTAHLGKFDYMAAAANTPKDGNVVFNFKHLGCLVEVNLILPDKGNLDSLQLVANENIFMNHGYIDLTTSQIISKTKSNKFLINCKDIKTSTDNENVKLYFMLAPTNANNKVVSVNVYNNGVHYTGSTTLKDFEVGKMYSLTINITGQSNVFHVKTPGTLANEMAGVNRYTIKNLKVTGPLNSQDIIVIRDIAGAGTEYYDNHYTPGKLEYLDLSEASFVYGGGYYWEHTDNDMDDPWTEMFCTHDDVLSDGMFQDCRYLKQIILPETINKIGGLAFALCESLQSIVIPNSVQTLDCYKDYGGIFIGCENLQDVKLSQNITEIPYNMFSGCNKLKSIDIPQKVTTIGGGAFEKCTCLTSVTIPDGVTFIGESAFNNCAFEYIKLPKELKIIEAFAFSSNTKLSSLTIPEKVIKIGHWAFNNCPQLLNVGSLPSTPPTVLNYEDTNLHSLGFSKECIIYVPPYAVGDYKYAVGWKDYANNIRAK